jgi:hypothetical protein
MAIVIGETIKHSDTVFRTPQNKIFIVILRGFDVSADKAFRLVGKTLNIPYSPRRPKILPLQSIITSNIRL